MAYPVRLDQLQQRVLQRTNLEGAIGTDSTFTESELTDNINQALAAWYDEVRSTTWNGSYYRSPITITTVAPFGSTTQLPPANAVYALPPDFLAATSVDGYVSPGCVISAKAFQEEGRNMYQFWGGSTAGGWFPGCGLRYQIQGAGSGGTPYIVVQPPPMAGYTIQVNYTPVAPRLEKPDDTIDSINGWDEYIVLAASIMMLMKVGRGEEIPQFEARLAAETARIRKMAPRRDQGTPERVHEVDGYGDGAGWGGYGGWGY